MLRSKLKGQANIFLRNKSEFTTFLSQGKFNRSHLAALVNQVYCPPTHLSAIYNNVARKVQWHILINSETMTWISIVKEEHFMILQKIS